MAIYRLLQQSAFGPEDIDRMTTAYDECLRVLKLLDRADPITELLAKYVIEIAQTGERDPFNICSQTLERLGVQRPASTISAAAPRESGEC